MASERTPHENGRSGRALFHDEARPGGAPGRPAPVGLRRDADQTVLTSGGIAPGLAVHGAIPHSEALRC